MTAAATTADSLDRATVDVGELRPKLRDGLDFAPTRLTEHSDSKRADYRIEDPNSGQFFIVGYAEYAFLSTLDGETSVAEAMSLSARLFREDTRHQADALSLHEATELIRWATANGLFQNVGKQPATPSPWSLLSAVNPLWLKLSLPSPERLLDALAPALGWTQSRAMILPLLGLLLASAVAALAHAVEVRQALTGILAVSNWLPLALVWTALKLCHELGHALACRQHGVEVRRCGIVFILLTPCPYVDATASWRLPSKWARIHIAAAGMIAELSIASLVLLAWPIFSSGFGFDPVWTQQLAANALFSATAATVLFNANPLMKFDGYYMLSDFMNAPNLATRGAAAAKQRLAHWFLGEPIRIREPRWIELYGWAAGAWRLVITVSLTAAASVLLPGIGLLIGLIGASASLLPPAVNAVRATLTKIASRQALAGPLCGLISLGALVSLLALPWPFSTTFPGVVTIPDSSIVRAGLDGFIEVVHVEPGAFVEADSPLFEIRNDETRAQRTAIEAELARSLARQRMLEADARLADAQIETQDRSRLRRQAALLDQQLARQRVTAAQRGAAVLNVSSSNQLDGTFVHEGDEVVSLVDPHALTISVAVPHHLIDAVRGREAAAVRIDLPTGHSGSGLIDRVAPAASTTPIEQTLLTPSGGPIAVRSDHHGDTQTAEPHFEMSVTPDPTLTEHLRAGIRVAVATPTQWSTGRHLWQAGQRWWKQLIETEAGHAR